MTIDSIAAAAAALNSDSAVERHAATRYLEGRGTPECRRILVEALSDGREHRYQLAIVLSRDPEAQAWLVRHMLQNADARVRVACAGMLAFRSATPTVSELRQALSDPTWEVALAAVTMLGRMGGGEACAALTEALAYPKWTVRFTACKSLIDLGDAGPMVITCLEELDASPWARWHNAHALMDRGQEGGLAEPTTLEMLARVRGEAMPVYGRNEAAAARTYLDEVEKRHAEHGSPQLTLEELL